jgi:hypothetical protein
MVKHMIKIVPASGAARLCCHRLGCRRPGRAQPVLGRKETQKPLQPDLCGACRCSEPRIARRYEPRRGEIWDGVRALDYLLTRSDVEPERINIIANRFLCKKIGDQDEVAVTGLGDAYTLAQATSELLRIKAISEPDNQALRWSTLVKEKRELWPIAPSIAEWSLHALKGRRRLAPEAKRSNFPHFPSPCYAEN